MSVSDGGAPRKDGLNWEMGSPGRRPVSAGPSFDLNLRLVLFSVVQGRLRFVAASDGLGWRLPYGRPGPGPSLDHEARRVVRSVLGVEERYLEQLYTWSVGDHANWMVIVSYMGLSLWDAAGSGIEIEGEWFDAESTPFLGSEDQVVLDYALVRLRAKIGYTTIAFHLLPPLFTLRELQAAYEAILDRTLDKRNFRRRMTAAGLIEGTAETRREGSHRPALLYRFRADHDPATYLTPAEEAR